jgi:hypothetical protein
MTFVVGLVELENNLRAISDESLFLQNKQREVNATLSNARQNIIVVLNKKECSLIEDCSQARGDISGLGMATDFAQVNEPSCCAPSCVCAL